MDLKILAKTNKPILITGETGTGKSLCASKLHGVSGRNKFLHVNLCNFSANLVESELFGNIKGAFTGASSERPGFFGEAGEGTLFLDELGDMPLEAQSKLLMILEEGIFYPVGSSKAKKFKGRLILATNKNLTAAIERGEFREDLLQRLKCYEVGLEPLRNCESLQEIIEDAFYKAKDDLGKPTLVLAPELMRFLLKYPWPGNYRELKNVCEYLALFGNAVLTFQDLPKYLTVRSKQTEFEEELREDYWVDMEAFEKSYLKSMLKKRNFRINQTAREIKVSKVTLLSKIKKYDIKREIEDTTFSKAQ